MFGWSKTDKKWYRTVVEAFALIIAFTALTALTVCAAGQTEIMQSAVDGNNLYLYIRELEEGSTLSGQIAKTKAEVTDVAASEIHTIILLDNSLSITQQNQEKAREILSAYVQAKEDTEQVSIATFGEEITYLTERETDADKLMEAMNGVTYENQDSFLSDILYDEIVKLENDAGYTRFIVVADGVDNKAIGYTKEELQGLLKKKNYPVYALGCVYKNNTEELENFFAIARLTKGNYFVVDEVEDASEAASQLTEQISRVTMEIPDECRDGGEKSVLLSIEASGGTAELTASASMPFQIDEKPAEPEPVEPEPVVAAEPEPEPVVAEPVAEPEPEPVVEEPEPEPAGIDPVTIIALVVIICAVVLLVLQKTKKKNKGGEKASGKKKQKETVADAVQADEPTVMLQEEEHTMFLAQNDARYIVVLKDANDPNKVFRYPLMDKVVIGRKNEAGVHIVLNYDSSVSGRHCEITVSGGHFYVEDLHSSNKTYLNGEMVVGRMEFQPGSSLRIGKLETIVDIVKR